MNKEKEYEDLVEAVLYAENMGFIEMCIKRQDNGKYTVSGTAHKEVKEDAY